MPSFGLEIILALDFGAENGLVCQNVHKCDPYLNDISEWFWIQAFGGAPSLGW